MSTGNILVTGGRGFVGARLVEMLSQISPAPNLIMSLDIKPITTEKSTEIISQLVGDFTDK